MSFYGGFAGGVSGGADGGSVLGGYDDLERYGESVFSRAKEKIIRNIAEDVFTALKVSGAKNAQSAPITEVVKHLAKICPNVKAGKKFNDKLNKSAPRQREVCLALAESINKNYHSNLISTDINENEMCNKVSEVMNSLFTGMHTEFMSVAGDVTRIINNLTTLRKFVDASYKRQVEIAQNNGNSQSVTQSNEANSIYELVLKELDRQMALLSNLMNVSISPTTKTLISLLEDNNDFKGMVRELRDNVGTSQFGDKIAYLLSGVNTVAHTAEIVDKALKRIGMTVKEYKNANNLQQLRLKIFEHIQKQAPSSKQMEGLMAAMEVIMKNTQNHDEIVKALEKHEKSGRGEEYGGGNPFAGGNGTTGGCCGVNGGIGGSGEEYGGGTEGSGEEYGGGYDYGEKKNYNNDRWSKKTLSTKIQKQDDYRKILMKDFKSLLKDHYQTLVSAVNEITPNIGKSIPINDDLDKFVSAFRNLKDLNRENLHVALSGYAKDITSKNEREDFINSYGLLLTTLEPLVKGGGAASSSFKNISSAVSSMMKSIDDFSDKMVKVITEIHVDNPTEINEALRKTSANFFGSAEGGGGDDFFGTGSFVAFNKVRDELIYFYSIANIKSNLNRSAAETASFGKDYEQVLGEGAGWLINNIKEEYKAILDALSTNNLPAGYVLDTKNCMGMPVRIRQAVDNYTQGPNPAGVAIGEVNDTKVKNMRQTLRDLYTYQRDAKIKMVETAQAVDLYLKSFTDGIAKNPEAISSVLSMLNQVQIVAKWFNDRSGDNLASLFETFPDSMDTAVGVAANSDPRYVNTAGAALAPGITNVIDGEKITLFVDDEKHYYDKLSQNINKNPGNPFIGLDIEDTTEDIKTNKANSKFKTLNALTERTIKSMRALENILSAFATVGNKFGDLNLQSKTFMTPGQIFNSLNQYVIASAYTNQFLPGAVGGDTVNKTLSKFRTVITNQHIQDNAAGNIFIPANNPTHCRHGEGNKFTSEYGYKFTESSGYGLVTGVSANTNDIAADINAAVLTPAQRKQHLRKHTSVAMAAIPTDSDSLENFWNYHAFTNRSEIRLDAAGYVDRFFDTDLLFMMTVKSIVCKVFTAVDAYRLFNRPTKKHYTHNSVNPIRTIMGGADVKVIPEALELYLRLPLLAEWYREVFGFKKNREDNSEVYVTVVPPSIDGIWSDFIRVIFDQTGYVNEGNYSENQVQVIIQKINEIYKTYKSKFPGVTVRNILNAFVVETNRVMGFLKKGEISTYLKNREKYINPTEDQDYISTESNFLNYDILESDNQFNRNPAPSDKYVSVSDPTNRTAPLENKFLMKEIIDLRKKMDYSFRKVLGRPDENNEHQNTTQAKKLNDYSFVSSLRNFKKSLDVAKNDKEAYEIVLNMIQGTNKLMKVAADKLLILHESVAAPLSVLYNVYKVMAKFNSYCHGLSTKNLEAFTKTNIANCREVLGLRDAYRTFLNTKYTNRGNYVDQFVDTAVATQAEACGLTSKNFEKIPLAVETAITLLSSYITDYNGNNNIAGAAADSLVIPKVKNFGPYPLTMAGPGQFQLNMNNTSLSTINNSLRKSKNFVSELTKQLANVVNTYGNDVEDIAVHIKKVYNSEWFRSYSDRHLRYTTKLLRAEVAALLNDEDVKGVIESIQGQLVGLLTCLYGSTTRNIGSRSDNLANLYYMHGGAGGATDIQPITAPFNNIVHPIHRGNHAPAAWNAPNSVDLAGLTITNILQPFPNSRPNATANNNDRDAAIALVNNQNNYGVLVELTNWFFTIDPATAAQYILQVATNLGYGGEQQAAVGKLINTHPLVRSAAFIQVKHSVFPEDLLSKHFYSDIEHLVDYITRSPINAAASDGAGNASLDIRGLHNSLAAVVHAVRNPHSLSPICFAIKSLGNLHGPIHQNRAIELAGINNYGAGANRFSKNLVHVSAGAFVALSLTTLDNFKVSNPSFYSNYDFVFGMTHFISQHINAAVHDISSSAFGYWRGARPNGIAFNDDKKTVFKGALIVRDTLSAVMDLATNPNKLVSCNINDVGFVNLDISKLEDTCTELLSLVKNNINKLRIHFLNDILNIYENHKYPGSTRWLEENLIDILFKNKGECGLPAALSDHLNDSLKKLTARDAYVNTLDNVFRELIYYRAERVNDSISCIIRHNNTKSFPFNVSAIKDQQASSTLLTSLSNEDYPQLTFNATVNPNVSIPAVGFESNSSLSNWDFTNNTYKSLLMGFNKLVGQYLSSSIEEGSFKSYIPLFDQFINSAGSSEIIQGNSFPNVFLMQDNISVCENAEYPLSPNSLPYLASNSTVLASPNENSVLFASYAHVMRNIVSTIDRVFKKKKHAYDNLNEMPEFMRERLRCNLPYFVKLFNIYYERAEFLKRLLTTNSNIKNNLSSVVTNAVDVPASQANLLDLVVDNMSVVSENKLVNKHPQLGSQLVDTSGHDSATRFKYFMNMLTKISEESLSLKKCADAVYKELQDVNPYFMDVNRDFIVDYKQKYNVIPLMPASHANLPQNLAYSGISSFTTDDRYDFNSSDESLLLLPSNKNGSNYYKFNLAGRLLLARSDVEPNIDHMPGAKDIYNTYANLTQKNSIISPEFYTKTLVSMIKLSRFVNDGAAYGKLFDKPAENITIKTRLTAYNSNSIMSKTEDLRRFLQKHFSKFRRPGAQTMRAEVYNYCKNLLAVGVAGIDGAMPPDNTAALMNAPDETAFLTQFTENIIANYDNIRKAGPVTFQFNTEVKETLALVENNNLKSAKELFVKNINDVTVDNVNSREEMRIYNILDMNIVPINIHAFMRETPFANILNYSYTFDQMVHEFIVPEKLQERSTRVGNNDNIDAQDQLMVTPFEPSNNSRELLTKLLTYPYADLHFGETFPGKHYYALLGSLFNGNDDFKLGRPRYLSDQLWHKVLLTSSVQLAYGDNTVFSLAGAVIPDSGDREGGPSIYEGMRRISRYHRPVDTVRSSNISNIILQIKQSYNNSYFDPIISSAHPAAVAAVGAHGQRYHSYIGLVDQDLVRDSRNTVLTIADMNVANGAYTPTAGNLSAMLPLMRDAHKYSFFRFLQAYTSSNYVQINTTIGGVVPFMNIGFLTDIKKIINMVDPRIATFVDEQIIKVRNNTTLFSQGCVNIALRNIVNQSRYNAGYSFGTPPGPGEYITAARAAHALEISNTPENYNNANDNNVIRSSPATNGVAALIGAFANAANAAVAGIPALALDENAMGAIVLPAAAGAAGANAPNPNLGNFNYNTLADGALGAFGIEFANGGGGVRPAANAGAGANMRFQITADPGQTCSRFIRFVYDILTAYQNRNHLNDMVVKVMTYLFALAMSKTTLNTQRRQFNAIMRSNAVRQIPIKDYALLCLMNHEYRRIHSYHDTAAATYAGVFAPFYSCVNSILRFYDAGLFNILDMLSSGKNDREIILASDPIATEGLKVYRGNKWIKALSTGNAPKTPGDVVYCAEVGRARFDTKLVRNLTWFVQLQRIMRVVLTNHLSWISEPVVKGLKITQSNITEYNANDKFDDDEYNVQQHNDMF